MAITSAIKPGANTLEINVMNLWFNRLLGDQQPDATKKYTYTAVQFYAPIRHCFPPGSSVRYN